MWWADVRMSRFLGENAKCETSKHRFSARFRKDMQDHQEIKVRLQSNRRPWSSNAQHHQYYSPFSAVFFVGCQAPCSSLCNKLPERATMQTTSPCSSWKGSAESQVRGHQYEDRWNTWFVPGLFHSWSMGETARLSISSPIDGRHKNHSQGVRTRYTANEQKRKFQDR